MNSKKRNELEHCSVEFWYVKVRRLFLLVGCEEVVPEWIMLEDPQCRLCSAGEQYSNWICHSWTGGRMLVHSFTKDPNWEVSIFVLQAHSAMQAGFWGGALQPSPLQSSILCHLLHRNRFDMTKCHWISKFSHDEELTSCPAKFLHPYSFEGATVSWMMGK